MITRSSKAKQELRTMPTVLKKKLRSELPRRRRTPITPIVKTRRKSSVEDGENSGFSVDPSSFSNFGGEVSFESSQVTARSEKKPSKAILRKRKLGESEILGDFAQSRSNYGEKDEPEVSESSCVESNNLSSGAGSFAANQRSKLKRKRGTRIELDKEIEEDEDCKGVSVSEISCVDQIPGGQNSNVLPDIDELNEVVSRVSGAESNFKEKLKEKTIEDGEEDFTAKKSDFCEVSRNFLDQNLATISNSESTIDQKPEISLSGVDSGCLACTEHFSYDSHETACSDLQSEFFLDSSDLDLSDYTPSLFFDSGTEFSERSEGDSPSSRSFTLLLQYRAKFSRLAFPRDVEAVSGVREEYIDQSEYMKFEDEVDEESYYLLRNREKRLVVLRDYIADYSATTLYGSFILQLREYMVHWMVENYEERNLQHETIFLGVSLLDRFLCKGFFKSKRTLQIVGIACLCLATRIEENQPHNSVRTQIFSFGNYIYNRCEVVAMEWLVQEVLNFQCFIPTIFNFLWFYLKATKAEEDVEKKAKGLAVLLLPELVHMYYMPSTIAAAVVISASFNSNDSLSHNVIETHMRTKGDDLLECIQSLEELL